MRKADICHRGRRRHRRHPTDFISVASTEGFRKPVRPARLQRRANAPREMHSEIPKIYFPPIAPTRYFSTDIPRVQCRVFLSAWPTSERETPVIIIGLSRNRMRKKRGRREKMKRARFGRDEGRKTVSSAGTQHHASPREIALVNYFLRRISRKLCPGNDVVFSIKRDLPRR
jgi:hypothetical protein